MFGLPRKPYSLEDANGKIIIVGGDGERDGKPADEDKTDDKEQEEQNDDKSDDSGSDDKSDDSGSDDKSSGPSAEDQLDEERRKNLNLQRQLDAEKAKGAKAEEDVDAAKDRDKEKARADKLQSVLDKNFLKWSIDSNKKYEWADPSDIPMYIKPDEIRIDLDKEEIEGLDLALKRIAKEKPHLLKPKEDDEEQDDKGRGPSGTHPRGGRTDQGDTEDDAIRRQFKLPGSGAQAVRPL